MESEATITHANDLTGFVQKLLEPLDIRINGNRPWDITIKDNRFYARALNDGALGLGEAYLDKWWNCDRLDIFFEKILRAQLDRHAHVPLRIKFKFLLGKFINFQSKYFAKEVAEKHYNLGNNLFNAMLDTRMIYSCGYWKDAQTLEDAQEAKLDLICQKLQLKPGLKLLDIGCGWGGLAKYAAQKYGVEVVGITISENQADYAKKYCEGLPIDIKLQDYRDVKGQFDRIVSVGMFEHVGHSNYNIFMKTIHRSLKENGLFLLHTIGINEPELIANTWMVKYIFPNGSLPAPSNIAKASEKLFVMEDWHNFGAYYDNTLMAWYTNFKNNWTQLKSFYNERFYRIWTYYLLSCAGGFRSRTIQLWQIVFSKNGVSGGYIASR